MPNQTPRTTRVCAGLYKVQLGDYTVEVIRQDHLKGEQLMARAEWDRFRYSDPVWTKREAMQSAILMLNQPWF